MASSPITSWQIDGETMETVTIFFPPLGSEITADDSSHEIKRHLFLGRKAMTNLVVVIYLLSCVWLATPWTSQPRQHIKNQIWKIVQPYKTENVSREMKQRILAWNVSCHSPSTPLALNEKRRLENKTPRSITSTSWFSTERAKRVNRQPGESWREIPGKNPSGRPTGAGGAAALGCFFFRALCCLPGMSQSPRKRPHHC